MSNSSTDPFTNVLKWIDCKMMQTELAVANYKYNKCLNKYSTAGDDSMRENCVDKYVDLWQKTSQCRRSCNE